jgi:hypothetical protein
MTPETFEILLIAEIEAIELPVRAYPQEPKNYFPEHDPGEVLVRYEGRKPVERDLSGLKSRVTFFAEIVVVTRQVRETGGAYDWLQLIYKHLQGRTLEGMAGQLTLDAESFMDETDGLWQFGQKWRAETDVYQTYTDDYEQHNLGLD